MSCLPNPISSYDKSQIMEENKDELAIDGQNEHCIVCLVNKNNFALVPCGLHKSSICYKCSQKIKNCPICRKKINTTIKIYKS